MSKDATRGRDEPCHYCNIDLDWSDLVLLEKDMEPILAVGAYEAKTKLGALLDEVAKGHSVTITRHGAPVAVMMPANRPVVPALGETVASLRAFRKGRVLGASVRDLIDEGRR